MQDFITVNTFTEVVCFCISLFCLFRDRDPVWRSLVVFLLLTCLFEFSGIYYRTVLHQPNFMVYNIFLVIECTVQNYFFYHLFRPYRNLAKLLAAWLTVFMICYFTELISNHFGTYVSASSTLLSVELILVSVYYYYLLLKEEKYRKLADYPPFWWVNGVICFYFAGIASNIFFSFLMLDHTHGVGHSARYMVFCVLNIIMYSSWSYSFICRYRQRILFSLSR